MTGRRAADESLAEAFRGAWRHVRGTCSEEDPERIWQAVAGELPASERRELVDRMATDPACAEAWRVADELWRASQGEVTTGAAERHIRSWTPSWLATAALLILGVSVGLVSWLNRPQQQGDEFRNPGGYVVRSLVPSETLLTREAFRLRWTPAPQGSRYQVRVTTRGSASVGDRRGPDCTGVVVEPRAAHGPLAGSAGAVAGRRFGSSSGERVSSETFVARVQ